MFYYVIMLTIFMFDLHLFNLILNIEPIAGGEGQHIVLYTCDAGKPVSFYNSYKFNAPAEVHIRQQETLHDKSFRHKNIELLDLFVCINMYCITDWQ